MMKSMVYGVRFLMAGLMITIALVATAVAKPVSPDFVDLAKKLKPTVVNIRTSKNIKPAQQRSGRNQFHQPSPFDDFFKDFFGQFHDPRQQQQPRTRREQSLGTGFIISGEGLILTNNHVVNGADEVMVKLSDGRELKAEIKGQDEKLDLALLKITDKEKLPVAELGNSDSLEVGEWVMAIGNPFGLAQTVTAGIVSAKGRVIGSGPYDDYIQTDASINPGNSGGPLFNSQGKVVGINTAIIAGGQGIGFAIPVNMAKNVVAQLKDNGKVTRGYLGVQIQPMNAELAKSFGLDGEKGALISDVVKDSPADKAGIKAGDIIMEFDGKVIGEYNELPRLVAVTPIDKATTVTIFRDGKRTELPITVGRLKDGGTEEAMVSADGGSEKTGIAVQELTKELAGRLELRDGKGVVITSVKPGSAAEAVGLMPGVVIIEVNGQRVETVAAYSDVVAKLGKGELLRLLVRFPDGNVHYVAMRLD